MTLATRVAGLQSADGYWHASLLDPASYPSPETSATGFIVYALAYGVNEGLLDKAAFMPVIQKGWKALTDAVEPDGKLGYVQPIGADPRKVTRDMTEVYGTDTFSQSVFHFCTACIASLENGPLLNSHPSLKDVTSRAPALPDMPSISKAIHKSNV